MKISARTALLSLLVTLTACDAAMTWLSGAYDGPQPSRKGLVQELVMVHRVDGVAGSPQGLLLDRLRFVESGQPHHVDRVIQGYTGEAVAAFQELDVRVGDTLVVTTRFFQMGEGGGDMGVPDWPGRAARRAIEYPVGAHFIVAAARAQ